MGDIASATSRTVSPGPASDTTLETSRLLVEFLHAAYATRRLDADAGAGEPMDGKNQTQVTQPMALSTHAVRAAIHVYQHNERTVGQLATGLGISYGWASRVVEELEAAGYATRERDADDRRVVRVRLNPARVGEVEQAYHWRGESVQAALEPLTESERAAVRLFLRRLTYILRGDQGGRH
jgi:DNA-binding MarR family transcriptional regulator